jgi:phospholipase/carboxylesterase
MPEKDAVYIEPEVRADAAVILMHGLGADGHDFESLVPELRLPPMPAIRWIFPHAPARPVTVNGGEIMRAWYDIVAIDQEAPEDEEGIRESGRALGAFIRAELEQGVRADRLVLAGFSQGGAMAMYTALRWPQRLAGLVAMSCYLPLASTFAAEAHPANRGLPVFMAHGTADPVVPFGFGETARNLLQAAGHEVEWHEYPMQHGVCQQEVSHFREWLLRTLNQIP